MKNFGVRNDEVRIRTLTREERIMEIAKMLSNAEVTEEAKRAAEVLIN